MSNKLSFEKCDEQDWNVIIENSYQSNLFSKIVFLKNCGSKFHLWKVVQGNEIKAGVCLNVDEAEENSIENKFIIHNGFFFNIDNKRILSKKREDQFQIIEFVIENLVTKYDKIHLSLDPQVKDIRPFQWFNYNKLGPKFDISIKYTSLLDITEFKSSKGKDEEDLKLFKNLEPVRRYSIRQAKKENFKIEFDNKLDKFLDLYKKFLSKNNLSDTKNDYKIISNISTELLKKNEGVVSYVYNNKSELIYSILTAWDNTKAYYLYGVASDKNKESWQGTIGIWSILKYIAINKNIKYFDFEGVNSPNRGWFKLGFGGELISYYQINYDKKKVYTN